jgi:hypothetical protein
MHLARTIELQSVTPSYPKAPRGVTPGARSGPKHRQLARQVRGVSLIQASSMAIAFQHKIALHPRSMFCFGTILSVADEEGTLHRIEDPPEKKHSLKISEKAEMKLEIAQLPALRAKTTSCKPGAENSFTRRTPLSTSSIEKWTQITRKKRNKRDKGPSSCPSGTSALKGEQKEACRHDNSILPRRPQGESGIVPHLRRRTNRAWERTSLARSSPTKEPTP